MEVCAKHPGTPSMASEKAERTQMKMEGSAQAQEWARTSFPETENPLCRDLMASESQGETEEKHGPSPICILEVLKKPHSSFWESTRSNKAPPYAGSCSCSMSGRPSHHPPSLCF